VDNRPSQKISCTFPKWIQGNPIRARLTRTIVEWNFAPSLRGSATMTREIHIVSVGLVFLFLGAFVVGVW
jgi:hypothetical protein